MSALDPFESFLQRQEAEESAAQEQRRKAANVEDARRNADPAVTVRAIGGERPGSSVAILPKKAASVAEWMQAAAGLAVYQASLGMPEFAGEAPVETASRGPQVSRVEKDSAASPGRIPPISQPPTFRNSASLPPPGGEFPSIMAKIERGS